jgi:hypothetical protein
VSKIAQQQSAGTRDPSQVDLPNSDPTHRVFPPAGAAEASRNDVRQMTETVLDTSRRALTLGDLRAGSDSVRHAMSWRRSRSYRKPQLPANVQLRSRAPFIQVARRRGWESLDPGANGRYTDELVPGPPTGREKNQFASRAETWTLPDPLIRMPRNHRTPMR